MPVEYAVVIPTIGRPSLGRTLATLAAQSGAPGPVEVVVVDDRPFHGWRVEPPVDLGAPPWPTTLLRSGGRGPAAARNAGWRATRSPWVVFLDDDVELTPSWGACLATDLAAAPDVGGVQGRIRVPVTSPTDWARSTAGLEQAKWATADMAYRRAALCQVGGFDERFPRAYREDADLALRVRGQGWQLLRGARETVHPVRAADGWVSLRVQAGAADDALMRGLHGPGWRAAARTGRGRFRWHVATVATAVLAGLAALAGRRRTALGGATGWALLTGDFLVRRLRPGPRPGDTGWGAEVRRMAVTSLLIPFAAVAHRLRGAWRHRLPVTWPPPVRAVLFDRDGTLVHDEPYNGDPARVRVTGGAREVLDDLRGRGIAVGVVTNQSGIGRGLVTAGQVAAVNARIDQELGPFDTWQVCPHAPDARCGCRKPGPLLVLRASAALGVAPAECAVVGDIGADVAAAHAAGARAVLVPGLATEASEVAAAPLVAGSLREAVALLGLERSA